MALTWTIQQTDAILFIITMFSYNSNDLQLLTKFMKCSVPTLAATNAPKFNAAKLFMLMILALFYSESPAIFLCYS